jgi:putative transposase
MTVIGVDPHKPTHTATGLDPTTNSDVVSLRIDASLGEYRRVMNWAKAWPERVTQSKSRKANYYDNALDENFFGHLKSELFHHNRFDTIEAFTTALDDEYIHWYNERISTKLKGLSPVQYRVQALAA